MSAMKKAYTFIYFLCLAILVCTSCKKKEEDTLSPDCTVISFGINSITSNVEVTNEKGERVTVSHYIYGGDIHFNIDQIERVIENKDYLPVWTRLDKVVPRFDCYGNMSVRLENGVLLPITSNTDTLNLTNPLTFTVTSTDGRYTKDYTVRINRHSEATDTVTWAGITTSNLQLNSNDFRTFVLTSEETDNEGSVKFVDHVYIFSTGSNGKTQVTSSTTCITWETPNDVEVEGNSSAEIDLNSITIHKNALYSIDKNTGILYVTDNQSKAQTWRKVADGNIERLLCSDGFYLYGFDGTNIDTLKNNTEWAAISTTDMEMLPNSRIHSFSSQTKHNVAMRTAVMVGNCNSGTSPKTVAWYKVSSLVQEVNQPWSYINITSDNRFPLPYFQDLSIIEHQDKLYAFGHNADGNMSSFYESKDNGITWHTKNRMWSMPSEAKDNAGAAVGMFSMGGTVWAVQNGGKVWKATIR